MSNKHTPGPWTVKSVRSGFYIESQFDVVVDIADPDGRYGTIDNEANARLIAAAPELLQALEVILDEDMEDIIVAYLGGFVLPDDLRRQARAAIAKAKGEQP